MIAINAIEFIDEDLREHIDLLRKQNDGLPLELIAMRKLNEALREAVEKGTSRQQQRQQVDDPETPEEKKEGISGLGLTPAKKKALSAAGVETVEDLCSWTKDSLVKLKGLGEKSAKHIEEVLWESYGLELAKASSEEEDDEIDEEDFYEEEEEEDFYEEEEEEEEEDFYDLLSSLPKDKASSVLKAFGLYQKAWGIDESRAQKECQEFTKDILVKGDPSTYPDTLNAFIEHLPMSPYQKSKIYELGKNLDTTKESLEKELPEAMCGKTLNKFTFGDADRFIEELELDFREDEEGLDALFGE